LACIAHQETQSYSKDTVNPHKDHNIHVMAKNFDMLGKPRKQKKA
jgi:hypothetical protein